MSAAASARKITLKLTAAQIERLEFDVASRLIELEQWLTDGGSHLDAETLQHQITEHDELLGLVSRAKFGFKS